MLSTEFGITSKTRFTIIGRIYMVLQRGDVVLVPFPFSDQSATKVRPAVIVSSDNYEQTEPDIILAALTTQIASATGLFDYTLAEWQQAGLRFASAFKPVFT